MNQGRKKNGSNGDRPESRFAQATRQARQHIRRPTLPDELADQITPTDDETVPHEPADNSGTPGSTQVLGPDFQNEVEEALGTPKIMNGDPSDTAGYDIESSASPTMPTEIPGTLGDGKTDTFIMDHGGMPHLEGTTPDPDVSDPSSSWPRTPSERQAALENESPAPESSEDVPEGFGLGRYQIDTLLQESRVMRCFKAVDTQSGNQVEIREFKDEARIMAQADAKMLAERFKTGQPAPEAFRHPSIVALVDFFVDAHRGPIAVLEWAADTTLAEQLETSQPWPPEAAAEIFLPLADAVAHIHNEGRVHGTLRPEMIAGTADGAYKLDLLPAFLKYETAKSRASFYAPPEIHRGEDPQRNTDVFSIGAMLLTAVGGSAPQGQLQAPESLQPLLSACLAEHPESRPSSLRLAQELNAIRQGQSAPMAAPARRNNLMLLLGLVFLAIAIAVILVLQFGRTEKPIEIDAVSEPSCAGDTRITIAAENGDIISEAYEVALCFQTTKATSYENTLREIKSRSEFTKALTDMKRKIGKEGKSLLKKDPEALRQLVERASTLDPEDPLVEYWRKRLNQSSK